MAKESLKSRIWKTLASFFRTEGGFEGKEIETPSSPDVGYQRIYPKLEDGDWYTLDSEGNETKVGAGGGTGGGVAIQASGTNVATSGTVRFINANNVSFGLSGQSVSASIPSYAAASHLHGSLALTNVSATSASNGLSISVAPPSGALWGDINGTISNQTDLQQNLNRLSNALSTGLLDGGDLSINVDDTLFDVAAGVGIIVDNY